MAEGTILILGATGAVGAALARRVAARGLRPALVARDAARLAALATEIPGSIAIPADVEDAAAQRAAVAAAGTPLAGLAYCVGSIALKPLKRVTEADMISAFRLNALGAMLAIQAAQDALAAGRGAVVLFSSIAARAGFTNHAAIAAAKGAVEGLTVALAAELAPAIRINCIAPSLTRSTMAAPLLANAQMAEAIAKQHPIPRLGEGDDAAALADFLLSDQAGWITGQIMAVDGGRSTLRSRG
ncbi:MAG: SDR family oxidoreductase [Roseomonas sp.]|nr:SDR family oxidoreductase [Roseomonas sp.]MCA3310006.1 SDR family oxidoreductase [Roseomonas sp.]MCA3317486.1 SDR family oxidoreductase [Roseomonas sp.]MCA3319416.1 SDR family oxidoreductase [Roseomonas sp.]